MGSGWPPISEKHPQSISDVRCLSTTQIRGYFSPTFLRISVDTPFVGGWKRKTKTIGKGVEREYTLLSDPGEEKGWKGEGLEGRKKKRILPHLPTSFSSLDYRPLLYRILFFLLLMRIKVMVFMLVWCVSTSNYPCKSQGIVSWRTWDPVRLVPIGRNTNRLVSGKKQSSIIWAPCFFFFFFLKRYSSVSFTALLSFCIRFPK